MVQTMKQETSARLANVPEEFVFWCNNGHLLRNMNELADELKSMADEMYSYHVNSEKNDFAKWVKDIIKDDWLAMNLQRTSSREQAARAVSDRVSLLRKKKA
jgi:hypothetical protein